MMTGLASNTALNASQPVLNVENMRLDVELWPLLSYRLSLSFIH
ncbi:AsmA family protein [Providencia stuartii MRSN 2154]|uniref:AsmA family protein n=1 Tax=Providencia stuartii (strain MRSN 2154) TaxID=1157951 RepID=A0A140NMR8_PROSM|nr:AsmA family protein [Providencia stuartii MRSN 2154]